MFYLASTETHYLLGLFLFKTMKIETKNKLLAAWQYCDDNDKSTEFMLQYMQDMAKVDLDCVINFIEKTTNAERQKCSKCVNLKEEYSGSSFHLEETIFSCKAYLSKNIETSELHKTNNCIKYQSKTQKKLV